MKKRRAGVVFSRECPGEDSNLHVLRHRHLKAASLPISAPGHDFVKSLTKTYLLYAMLYLFSIVYAKGIDHLSLDRVLEEDEGFLF